MLSTHETFGSIGKSNPNECEKYGKKLISFYDMHYPFDESDLNYPELLKQEKYLLDKMHYTCSGPLE